MKAWALASMARIAENRPTLILGEFPKAILDPRHQIALQQFVSPPVGVSNHHSIDADRIDDPAFSVLIPDDSSREKPVGCGHSDTRTGRPVMV